ncbi:MAG: hypothetical protein ACK5Y2_12690 [Bdellovibrionales bacterium]
METQSSKPASPQGSSKNRKPQPRPSNDDKHKTLEAAPAPGEEAAP